MLITAKTHLETLINEGRLRPQFFSEETKDDIRKNPEYALGWPETLKTAFLLDTLAAAHGAARQLWEEKPQEAARYGICECRSLVKQPMEHVMYAYRERSLQLNIPQAEYYKIQDAAALYVLNLFQDGSRHPERRYTSTALN